MNKTDIFLGDTKLHHPKHKVEGGFVSVGNEKYYKISNYNILPDFFMTIVSHSDHWMYLSSNGSLTAGRKDRNNALFPYYTEDKIYNHRNLTGSKTYCLVEKNDKIYYWEPFTDETEKIYTINRHLYKSIYGNKVIFEELNYDLGLSFKYGWYNSEKFGWVKRAEIENIGSSKTSIKILDGLRNVLPYGVDYFFQNEYSNLADAYKKNELLPDSHLGLFMLSSIPVDRAEPSEALKTTTVWSCGTEPNSIILISDNQLKQFKEGLLLETEYDIRASKGCYYIQSEIELAAGAKKNWYFVAELNQGAGDVVDLDLFVKHEKHIIDKIEEDIRQGTDALVSIVAGADGIQIGKEELSYARHFSNTLYNIMRGGVFADGYLVDTRDFQLYLQQTNRSLLAAFESKIRSLPGVIRYPELIHWAREFSDPDLERICIEYLPLTFSRRHGDPSRPWNQFSIELKNEDGTKKLNYQGNWRDIFQNWEALSLSYPEYIEGMICKFMNASTPDGYNPYRITREGIDWESPDPHDPWAYIGYWGDHQIIYLQKFLEHSNAFHPGQLDELLTRDIFVYANVPYRIKSFEAIVENPKDTICFDHPLNKEIQDRALKNGADGKLLLKQDGGLQRANLMEKILITLLAKLSNFVPEAGIWMNTQRPEWNDANNALVGNGASMVTLYYLRRFLMFWKAKLESISISSIEISNEIKTHLDKTFSIFSESKERLGTGFTDAERYAFTAGLGHAGSAFRDAVYKHSFSGKKTPVDVQSLLEFTRLSLQFIDQSIDSNKREDGPRISIRHLYEMLEGQVAVLSSRKLSVHESLDVLDALKASNLFRKDQYSYLLYPDRQLPRFIEKNNIPPEKIKESALLQKLLSDKNSQILTGDLGGNFHFNGIFRNAAILGENLDLLDKNAYGSLVEKDKELVLGIYEEIFDHQSFTGRSGTFYGYEGLGSIYWHMVSKLLLACQECYFKGIAEGLDQVVVDKIKDHYYEIKAGIGLYKSPELYGAFPTDAYSHTPANSGAKQPGLTGQVKEDFISRIFELGISIDGGRIVFSTTLLNHNELLKQNETFHYIDINGNKRSIFLNARQLAFTFCQVPVIYAFGEKENIVVRFVDGTERVFSGKILPKDISSKIFTRNGEIESVKYHFPLG